MLTERIQRTMGLGRDSQGRPIQYMEIDVSTAEELPASGVIDGVKVGHGSIAHGVQTGEFWSWDGAAEAWYNQDGSDAPSPSVQTTQAAKLNVLSPTVVRPQTQLNTIPEDDNIEDIEEVTENEPVRGAESE